MTVPVANVPNAPGVPNTINNDTIPQQPPPPFLTADTAAFPAGSLVPVYGIFRGGVMVVQADSVIDFIYRKEFAISDYPVEQGGFESFDKVYLPFEGRFRFACGGSPARRAAFLAGIDTISNDLNFYDIVTPDAVYTGVNVMHYDYKRAAQSGVSLLVVDIWCEEVRQVNVSVNAQGQPGINNPADASAASPANGGQLTPSNTPEQLAPLATSTLTSTTVTPNPQGFGIGGV